MILKPWVLALLAAGCLTAAAGGAYVAVRQNTTADMATTPIQPAAPPAQSAAPVAETEAIVKPTQPSEPQPAVENPQPVRSADAPAGAPTPRSTRSEERRASKPDVSERRAPRTETPARRTATEAVSVPETAPSAPAARPESVPVEPVRFPDVQPTPPEPQLIEVVVPASSVIGLQVETALSSERARVEDRVEARVTRDVSAAGRVAIPAGSRVIGSVTLVDRGGKIKERARLGVRFHTLVFADGTEVPIRTEAIFREGNSPGRESSAKIGGAAVGGAILGAILGGGKGAVLGGATGAAGGTAAVMAGDRNAATLPSGTVVTVRLSDPVAVEVEKR